MNHGMIDWTTHGDEIVALYVNKLLSVREVSDLIEEKYGTKYPSGTLTNFLGRRGVLRSKTEARKLAISKSKRICDVCNSEHVPKSWNQRWCDECSGKKKYSRRLTAHGIPAAVVEKQFELQEHACAICKKKFDSMFHTPKKKRLFIDHDHTTNQFRGLLCVRCNTALGYIDDKKWLDAAFEYLKKAAEEKDPIYAYQPRKHSYVRHVPIKNDDDDRNDYRLRRDKARLLEHELSRYDRD